MTSLSFDRVHLGLESVKCPPGANWWARQHEGLDGEGCSTSMVAAHQASTRVAHLRGGEAYLTSRDNSEPESDRTAGVSAAGWWW